MLKTNSKAVEMKVVEYLKDVVEFNSGLENIVESFNDYNQFDYEGYNNIIDFMVCMGTFGITVWYSEQRELLQQWLEQTKEQASKYNNEQVYSLFINLLERVFLKHYKLHKTLKYNFRNQQHSKGYLVLEHNQ